MTSRILRNAAQCLACGEVIESKYTHDFVMCKCGNLGVDGGLSYAKRVGNPGGCRELSVYEESLDG